MKNCLLLLKRGLLKSKNVYVSKTEQIGIDSTSKTTRLDNHEKIVDIANKLGLEFALHNLKKLPSSNGRYEINRYSIDDNNMIFLYPVNDSRPTCPFEFCKDGKLIIHNQNAYSEIINLDEIILQMVRVFNKALDEGIVIDPYYFMLRLDDDVKPNYKGNATLIITDKAIRNQKLNEQNFDEANKYFINRFLDHFIGWNFGVSVNRNEILKGELEELNKKVIDKGIREYAGPGFEVHGVENKAYQGLQHYYLSTSKDLAKKKTLKSYNL